MTSDGQAMLNEAWRSQLETLGGFIRTQRRLANLSLRDMAALANVSNPYLSQIERGLHEPSVRVLKAIATALDLSAETLLAQAGLLHEDGPADPSADSTSDTETAIRVDPKLSDDQKEALLAVYRGFLATKG
ncbi:MAG: helix-turn-helix transcriptional regulator [Actinomycetota bacterium]|nr:helix-turn-helix transcriptional regulator [Actinomycetota bacterium]